MAVTSYRAPPLKLTAGAAAETLCSLNFAARVRRVECRLRQFDEMEAALHAERRTLALERCQLLNGRAEAAEERGAR